MLGLLAVDPGLSHSWSTGGMPTLGFTRNHRTKQNELYVKQMKHGRLNSDATTTEIWQAIADDNLPITLNIGDNDDG